MPCDEQATDSRKRLALSICDFLATSLKDGTLQPEDADSVEIATNCIADIFHVDPSDHAAVQDALGGQSLLAIFGVYEKLKGKSAPAAPSAAASDKSVAPGSPTDESEKLKGMGNAAMQKKDYQTAVDHYTKALEVCPLNPIYLSNRAAAYSAMSQHEFAKNDAELATATDPKYTKAWSRLGLARFALGDAKGAMDAYKQGIDAEGNGGSDAMKKGYETAKRKAAEQEQDEDNGEVAAQESTRGGAGAATGGGMPDLASMFGGGGAGGMPDLGSLMQNPMMRQMAQNLMSNPDMMNNIMNNPRLREMAGQFGGGGGGGAGGGAGSGGMPDLSSLMNDPNIADLARNFMGGAGRGAGGNQ